MIGVFIIQPQEGLFPNHGYKARAMFITKAVIGFENYGGSINSPLGAEMF
jgi:hypothetical protein